MENMVFANSAHCIQVSLTSRLELFLKQTKLLPTPGALIPVISPLWNDLPPDAHWVSALSFLSLFCSNSFFLGAVFCDLKHLTQPSSVYITLCPRFASHHCPPGEK